MNNLVDKLKEYLDSKTDEELQEEWKDMFGDEPDIPKGWISIEDHLPTMLATDFLTGTQYKVKFSDGRDGKTPVSDHNVWYYMAKDEGITHWWNE